MAQKRAKRPLDGEGWLDISIDLKEGMAIWPGDPAFRVRRFRDMGKGAEENVSAVEMSVHSGTHIDAPVHYLKGEAGIDELPFDTVIGAARVIEIRDPGRVTPDELRRHAIGCGERVLLKTRNSVRCCRSGRFVKDYVYITADAARFLAETRVRMVGIDYLSAGGYVRDGVETHRTLLGAGIWIVEGLNLSRISAGACDLICLPLNIPGCDGAPARAILRPQE